MAMRPMCKTKNGYQIMLANYNNRKSQLRDCCKTQEEFVIRVKKLNDKIHSIRRAIRTIEKRERFLNNARLAIIEYNGVDVKLCKYTKGGSVEQLSKFAFFKFCIESGIGGGYVARFLKIWVDTPTLERLNFTRSFKVSPKNRDFYHSISAYIKQFNK